MDRSGSGASAGVGWVATPTLRFDLRAGYGRDRPELRRSRNESKWVQAGVSVAVPKGFTVGGGSVRWTDFEAPPHTPDDERREDKNYNLRLSVFNRAFTFFGFSPEVSVIHEICETYAQLYDYKHTSG